MGILDQIKNNNAAAKTVEVKPAAVEPVAVAAAPAVTPEPVQAKSSGLRALLDKKKAAPAATVMGPSAATQIGVKPAVSSPAPAIAIAQRTVDLSPAPVAAGADDLLAAQNALRSDIDFLLENFENKDAVGQVVRKIYLQLRTRPALAAIMSDTDYDNTMRALKKAYQHQALTRTEKRGKRAEKREAIDMVSQTLSDMGFDLND